MKHVGAYRIRPKTMKSEIVRFIIVGTLAVAVQFGVYQLLLPFVNETLANTAGYIVSFCLNFLLSTYFTFRVRPDRRKAAGFALSHVLNYLMQTLTLNLILAFGCPSRWAQLPMFALCVPLNFVLVRYFLKRKACTNK